MVGGFCVKTSGSLQMRSFVASSHLSRCVHIIVCWLLNTDWRSVRKWVWLEEDLLALHIHYYQEAGYRGKSLFTVEEEEEEDSGSKVDDEVCFYSVEIRMILICAYVGASSSLEHHPPLYQCFKGQVSAVCEWSSWSYRLWRRFLIYSPQPQGACTFTSAC